MHKWIGTIGLGVMLGILAPLAAAQQTTGTASDKVSLNIAAQPIGDALNALAAQTGLQVVLYSDQLSGQYAPALVGRYTAHEALERILSNTAFKAQFIDAHTVAILPTTTGSAALSAGEERVSVHPTAASRLALARSDTQTTPGASPATSRELVEESNKGVPEILVKGARSVNVDIRRTEDDPQPYVVFDAEELRRSNAPNLEEFFKNRLPMNTVQTLPSQFQVANTSFSSAVNLRGLGTNQTLILVDGRRMPGTSLGDINQAEIKGIPLSSIERIEILSSTAGGIYGGGATGGVINIITRGDYAGMDVRATYGNTLDTDATERRVDVSGGFSLGRRTHVRFSGAYADSNALASGDRDFAARGRALLNANTPFDTMTTPPLGYTTNICTAATVTATTCSNAPLVLDSGVSLGSNHTFVPAGYARTDGGAALAGNAGKYDIGIPSDLNGAYNNLLDNPTLKSVTLNVRHEFGERVEAFIDLSRFDNKTARIFPATVTTAVTLAANVANNPFSTPIRVSFPVPGLTNTFENTSVSSRATAGVIVQLPHDWTAEADYSYSRSRWESRYGRSLVNSAGDAALTNGTFDVMRDLNAFPLNYAPYLLTVPNSGGGPAPFKQKDATLRASGPVFSLPGGAVTLSGVAERREENADSLFTYSTPATGITTYVLFPDRSQDIDSYSLETRVPLVSTANALPGVRALDLQLSVRRDDYSIAAPSPSFISGLLSRDGPLPAIARAGRKVDATRYTAALSYMPVEDLTLRASLGTGFLPPALSQLAPSAPSSVTALNATALLDPKRGGATGSVGAYTSFSGGRADLEPEDSQSWSTGLVFTPRFLSGLRLSVDYTHIAKTNEITSFSPQSLLDLENVYPSRVTRGTLTAGDIALGYTGGPVSALDISSVNVARTRLAAYDFQADYAFDIARLGRLHFYAIGTYAEYLKRRALPNANEDDSVGFTSGPLPWRGNLGLVWDKNAWSVAWNSQYFDGYRIYAVTATPAARTTAIQQQGSETIESQMYHDVMVSYRLEAWDTEVALGIQNVFDQSPPILATLVPTGGYSTYGDPRLRRYSISISKQF